MISLLCGNRAPANLTVNPRSRQGYRLLVYGCRIPGIKNAKVCCAFLIGLPGLPALLSQEICGRGKRVRYRIEINPTVAIRIDTIA